MPVTDRFGNERVVMAPVEVDEDTLRKVAETHRRRLLPRHRHRDARGHLRDRSTSSSAPRRPSSATSSTASSIPGRCCSACWSWSLELALAETRAAEPAVSFANPLWLLAALATVVAALLFWRAADRWRRAALERFAAPQLLPDLTAALSARRRVREAGAAGRGHRRRRHRARGTAVRLHVGGDAAARHRRADRASTPRAACSPRTSRRTAWSAPSSRSATWSTSSAATASA